MVAVIIVAATKFLCVKWSEVELSWVDLKLELPLALMLDCPAWLLPSWACAMTLSTVKSALRGHNATRPTKAALFSH